MKEFSLSEHGLETVADACARKGWAARSVQNWINAGLLSVAVVGSGRTRKFILRKADVDAFVLPTRGAPRKTPKPTRKRK